MYLLQVRCSPLSPAPAEPHPYLSAAVHPCRLLSTVLHNKLCVSINCNVGIFFFFFCFSASIPPQFKLLVINVQSVISDQLNTDNRRIWRSQIFKLFFANDFDDYLDYSTSKPQLLGDNSVTVNPHFHTLRLIDQNLAAARIAHSIIPYVLHRLLSWHLAHC
ncbi:hypothetical protein KFK09_002092 [Dendrobium nobile]|uniref:Uncharacterized protein n=1 Tax=Dendrobium nobile TaxID=94219 RepID=A0A8T3C6T1_DENNO|nr:hypothetical protein KFK09_002092 [Dendrobium nobile]